MNPGLFANLPVQFQPVGTTDATHEQSVNMYRTLYAMELA
jgi:hypothetical protein